MSDFLETWISFADHQVAGQTFVHFLGKNISGSKNFEIMVVYNFLLHLMGSFDQKQKFKIFRKKVFTDRKNDDVTFLEMGEVKILPPLIFFNFGTQKSLGIKYCFQQVQVSETFFLNIRPCDITSIPFVEMIIQHEKCRLIRLIPRAV